MRSFGSRRGGVLFGLTLSGLFIICLIIAGAVYLARNIVVNTAKRNGGDLVSIDMLAGRLLVQAHGKAGAAISGIPIYPGARTQDSGGDAIVEWTSNDGADDKEFGVSASKMVTSDSVDKVVDYYKSQLPAWLVVAERNGGVRLELREGGYKRLVAIHREHDATHIAVASVGEPAAN